MRRIFRSPLLAAAILGLALFGGGRGQDPDPDPDLPPEDPGQPRLIVQTGHTSEVYDVAFSPDSHYVLSTAVGSSRLWDVRTGKELMVHGGGVSVIFSKDGKRVLRAATTWAEIFDVQTGKEIVSLPIDMARTIKKVALAPSEELFATGGKQGAHLWNAHDGRLKKSFGGKMEYIHAVAFSPDGKHLLTASKDHTQIWDVKQLLEPKGGKKNPQAFPSSQHTRAAVYAPDGKHIALGILSEVEIRDAQTGKEVLTMWGHKEAVTAVAFAPYGKHILSGSEDRTARVWDTKTGKEVHLLRGHTEKVTSVAWSPNGKYLVTGSNDETVRLWDAHSGKELRVLKGPGPAHQIAVFSRDGTRILTCGRVVLPRLWDLRTGAGLFVLKGHTAPVTSGVFSPDGTRVLTGSHDRTARLWDAQTGAKGLAFEGHKEAVTAVAFAPDGKRVLTGSADKTARLWDAETGKEMFVLNGQDGHVTAVAFSPDGKRVLTGSDGTAARLWDAETGKQLHVLHGAAEHFRSVAFAPDGKRVLTGSDAKAARLWDAQTGKLLKSFDFERQVTSVAFSPDGKHILVGVINRPVYLLNAETGAKVNEFKGHRANVTAVTFSDDGKYVLTGCEDNMARVWEVATGKEVCRLISFGAGWAVVDAAGRYDASNGGDVDGLHWVVNMEPIALHQLKDRFYEPGLLAKHLGLNKEPVREAGAFKDVKLYPEVAVEQADPKKPQFDVGLTNSGGGIGRVVVLVNGKELTADARPRGANAKADKLTLQLDLSNDPRLVPGKTNTIEVQAYNAEGNLSSRGLVRDFDAPGAMIADPPTLHAVVVGVSKYRGNELNLRYASKDAEDFANALGLAAGKLFGTDKVALTLLTSTDDSKTLRPNRANLVKTLEALKATKPNDLVVVYLAGHGVTQGGPDGDWHYLTADAQEDDLVKEAALKQVSLSSKELTDLLKEAPARKQVLILDTCHSGRVVEKLTEKRDVPGSQVRALERVKDRTGMHVLAGCAADSVSYEASRYGQGILTYSLLLGMRGAKLRENEYVDVVDLFGFAADKVPELARDIGGVQRPTIASPRGASFDIGRLTAEDRDKVPLQAIKPVLLRSIFQQESPPRDTLGLSKRINDQLREMSATPRGAQLVFVDADEFAGGVFASGRYTIVAGKTTVNVSLYDGDKEIAKLIVEGLASEPDKLAGKIAAAIEKRLSAIGVK